MNFIEKNIMETHSFNFAATSPSLFRSHVWVQLFFLKVCRRVGVNGRKWGVSYILAQGTVTELAAEKHYRFGISLGHLWTPVNIPTQPGCGVSSARAALFSLPAHRSEPAFQLWQPYLPRVCARGSPRTELKHSHRKSSQALFSVLFWRLFLL